MRARLGSRRAARTTQPREMLQSAIIGRLVEKAMGLARGDVAGTVRWLTQLGCTVVHGTDDEASVRGTSGIVVGFSRGIDPVNAAVTLAFGLIGELWPWVMPELLARVDTAWREEVCAAKEAVHA